MYKITLTLPGLPKTTNSGGRAHWAMKVKEAKKWHHAILSTSSESRPAQPLQKAKLTLIRYSSRRPDFDGLVSSFKHVIDGLKQAKIITDDKYENIGNPQYEWMPVKSGQGKIEVTVEEVLLSNS